MPAHTKETHDFYIGGRKVATVTVKMHIASTELLATAAMLRKIWDLEPDDETLTSELRRIR